MRGEALEVLFEDRVVGGQELLLECREVHLNLLNVMLLVVDPDSAVSRRVAHLLLSVLYQLIQHIIVVLVVLLSLINHIRHHRRTVERSLVRVIHLLHSLQLILEIPPHPLQTHNVRLQNHNLLVRPNKPNVLNKMHTGLVAHNVVLECITSEFHNSELFVLGV